MTAENTARHLHSLASSETPRQQTMHELADLVRTLNATLASAEHRWAVLSEYIVGQEAATPQPPTGPQCR